LYTATLRAISQGKAKFSMQLAEYAPVPTDLQHKLTEAYAKTNTTD
jgi:translation elongation factor EF-G